MDGFRAGRHPSAMSQSVLLEICIDSVESALAAQAGGADRVELCSSLFEGGLTPSAGLMEVVRSRVKIAVAAMLRPRGGDFCYTDDEFLIMQRDLVRARELGADALVFGILKPDGSIDGERNKRLIEMSRPLSVTFHRAFDMVRDPHEAFDTLLSLGVDRVLTSGLEKSAVEGMDLIAELVKRGGSKISVMPGGGITERNLQKVLKHTGAREIHGSASGTREGPMTFRNTRIFMGGQLAQPEYSVKVAKVDRVKAFRELAV